MAVPVAAIRKSTKARKRLEAQSEEILRLREEMAELHRGFQGQVRQIAEIERELLQEKGISKRQAERIEQLELSAECEVVSLAQATFRVQFERTQFPSIERELMVIQEQLAGERPILGDRAVIIYDRLLSERKTQIEAAQQVFQATFGALPVGERIDVIHTQLREPARRPPALAPVVAQKYLQLLEQANDTNAAEQEFASYQFAIPGAYPSVVLRLARVETLLKFIPVPIQFPTLTPRQKTIFEDLLKEEQANIRAMQVRFESSGFNDPIRFPSNEDRLAEVQRQQAPAAVAARALSVAREQIYSNLLAEALAEFNQIEAEAQKRFLDKHFEQIADLRERCRKVEHELTTVITLGLEYYQREAYERRLRIERSRLQGNIMAAEAAVSAHQFAKYSCNNRYRRLEAIDRAKSVFTSAGFMLQEGEQQQLYQFLLAKERSRTEAAMRSSHTHEELRESMRRRRR